MVTTKDFIDLSLDELENFIMELISLRNKKYNELFKTIKIYPGRRIEGKIKEETGYYCYHVPATGSAGRGTHIIVIPREKYTEELEKELIEKYDDKW